MVQGFFKQVPGGWKNLQVADGTLYGDLDDAPWAAGWTGWSAICLGLGLGFGLGLGLILTLTLTRSAIWLGACGNVFSHELGHSLSLSHFTDSDQCQVRVRVILGQPNPNSNPNPDPDTNPNQGRLPASHTAEQCIAEVRVRVRVRVRVPPSPSLSPSPSP